MGDRPPEGAAPRVSALETHSRKSRSSRDACICVRRNRLVHRERTQAGPHFPLGLPPILGAVTGTVAEPSSARPPPRPLPPEPATGSFVRGGWAASRMESVHTPGTLSASSLPLPGTRQLRPRWHSLTPLYPLFRVGDGAPPSGQRCGRRPRGEGRSACGARIGSGARGVGWRWGGDGGGSNGGMVSPRLLGGAQRRRFWWGGDAFSRHPRMDALCIFSSGTRVRR